MARRRDRVVALILAILFFATSVGVSLAIIWQMVWHKDPTSTNESVDTSKFLQGTQLADFTPVPKVDKLQVTEQQAGTGKVVKDGDTVLVDYTGALASTGIIFQSSLDAKRPVSLKLTAGPDGVIKGWVDGLVGIKEGGKRRLVIPASLAYGDSPPTGSGIPANADLVFDITVQSIMPSGGGQ